MARAMKDSGVAWIGKIPLAWEVTRGKDMLAERNKRSKHGTEELLSLSAYTGVKPRREMIDIEDSLSRADSLVDYKVCHSGDIVINTMLAWNGSIGLSRHTGIVSPAYAVYQLRKGFEARFVEYLLRSDTSLITIRTVSRGINDARLRLYPDSLFAIQFGVPPFIEQRAIADYLDRQTALIDQRLSVIADKQAVLTELRKAIIQEAVTKGATWNAEAGQIENLPNGWKATQVKRLLCFITSGSRGWAEYYADEGDIFLRIGNLTRETIELDLNDVQYVRLPVNAMEGSRTRIKEGDMLVSITADLGSIAIAPKLDKPAYVNQHIALCRPNRSVLPRWLGYAMVSLSTKQQFINSGYGGTKIQLSLDDVRHIWLAVPPPAEQLAIANHLDQQTKHIAAQLATLDEQMKVLKELRKAIIHEAVTGKIDLSGGL